MSKYCYCFLSIFIFFISISSFLIANEEEKLDLIVVTADRSPELLKNVSQNIILISEEEIEKSQANDLVDLLKKYGIQTTVFGSENFGREGIVLRGRSSSTHGFDLGGDILVLIDGRRTGTDALNSFAIQNAQTIEVIKGPGGVQYGSSAMGGVINIISKKGSEDFKGNFEAGYGSWDQKRFKGFLSGRKEKLDFAFSGSYYEAADYKTGGGDKIENSALDYRYHYNANLGWNFSDLQRISISALGTEGKKQGAGTKASLGLQKQDSKNDTIDFVYDGKSLDEKKSWLLRYYNGKTDYSLNKYNQASDIRYVSSTFDNSYQGVQAQVNFDFDRYRLIAGLDWLKYDLKQNQPAGYDTTLARANKAESTYENIGVFLLNKFYLLEERNLVLQLGFRQDFFKVNVDSERGQGTASYLATKKENNTNKFLPSFGAAYNANDYVKFRGNVGYAFKMPTPRQLGGVFNMGSSTYYGNPNLKPESGYTWDMGFDVDYEALDISFTYFDSRYKDKVSPLRLNATERTYVNLEKARISGLEFYSAYDLGETFKWNFELKPYVSWTELFTYEDNKKQKLANVSRTSLAYGLDFNHWDLGLTANLNFNYLDYREGHDLENGGPITLVDFSATKKLYEFNNASELKLKVAVKNIFDKKYESEQDYYTSGRSFYTALNYSF